MTGVNIKVRADARQAQNELRKLNLSMDSLDKQAKTVTRTFQKLAIGITAAIGSATLVKGITRAADSMTNLSNRVKLVTKDAKQTEVVLKKLFDVAARSRGDVETAAETFNRFGLSLQGSGRSVEELLVVTEAVQRAATISGASAESAKNAIIQLGQGLASGQLRGEELNSVLEQMPRLAQAIADGMGIPFGKLREEAKKGRLEGEAVFDAIFKGAGEIETEFRTLNDTVAGLGTVFGNEFTRAVAELDKVVGVSEKIKSVIIAATNAVRFFGENIGDWAFVLGSRLLIGKVKVIAFTEDVKDALGNLFSGSIDGAQLAQNFIASLGTLKEEVEKKVGEIKGTISGVFSDFSFETIIPKTIDLSKGLFTGLDAALKTVRAFVGEMIQNFWFLWNRVIGSSLYTGIFDPSHEEGGAAAIGNTSKIKTFLDKALGVIDGWRQNIVDLFENLHNNATEQWDNLVEYVNNLSFNEVTFDSLPQNFNAALSRMRDSWSNFTSYLTTKTIQTPGGPEEVETNFGMALRIVGETWNSVVAEMETRWEQFYNFLTTKEVDTPAGIKTVETQFGSVLRRMEEAFNGFLQKVMSFGRGTEVLTPFEAPDTITPEDTQSVLLENLKSTINNVTEAIKDTPIVVGIKVLGLELIDSFESVKSSITSYFDKNKDVIAVAITSLITAALSAPIREKVISAGIAGAFAGAAGIVGNNEEFLSAARSTAESFGKTIHDLLSSGEGDFVANIISGMANLGGAIVEGFVEGLFGTEFENETLTRLSEAIGLVLVSFAIAPGLVKAFITKFYKALFGGAIEKEAKKSIQRNLRRFIGAALVGYAFQDTIMDALGIELESIGVEIGAVIASGIAVNAAFNAISNATVKAIRGGMNKARSHPMLRFGDRNSILYNLGRSMAGRIAAGIIAGKVLIGAAIAGAIATAVVGGYLAITNKQLKKNELDRIAIGITPMLEPVGLTQFKTGIEQLRSSVLEAGRDAIESGETLDLSKGLENSVTLNKSQITTISNNLEQAVKDLQANFPGFVVDKEALKATLKDALTTAGTQRKAVNFSGVLKPVEDAVEQIEEGVGESFADLTEQAEKDSETLTQALLNAEAAEAGEALVGVFDKLSESEIITDDQISQLEEGATSVDRLSEAFQRLNDTFQSLGNVSVNVKTSTDSNSSDNEVSAFASGGYVSGPGTATSDSIPAMLSDGEFVMKAAAVRKFGAGFMARINAGIMPQKFNEGGLAMLRRNVEALKAEYEAQKKANNWHLAGDVLLELREAQERYHLRAAELAVGSGSSSPLDPDGIEEAASGRNSGSEDGRKAATDYADSFKSDFKAGLAEALVTGDVKGFLTGLLDSFTSKIIEGFVDSFTESLIGTATDEGGWITKLFEGASAFGKSIGETTTDGITQSLAAQDSEGGFLSNITGFFKGMFEQISKVFSGLGGGGGGDGGFISTAIGFLSKILPFSQGGIVPNTPYSQAGKDSVPAMLMPGEVVLSKNDVSRMENNKGQQQQVFNINVSGDVTRQTRQEIVKMMPQITAGVNDQNRERNFKSR